MSNKLSNLLKNTYIKSVFLSARGKAHSEPRAKINHLNGDTDRCSTHKPAAQMPASEHGAPSGACRLGLLLAAAQARWQGQEADQTMWTGQEGRTLEHESVGEQFNERTQWEDSRFARSAVFLPEHKKHVQAPLWILCPHRNAVHNSLLCMSDYTGVTLHSHQDFYHYLLSTECPGSQWLWAFLRD